MIADFYLHQLAGSDQVAGDFDVRLGRVGFAGGMIVHHHNSGRGRNHGNPEDFSRMDEDRVERANRDEVMAAYAAPRVQKQYRKAFALPVEKR
jgi:hypothetical protein